MFHNLHVLKLFLLVDNFVYIHLIFLLHHFYLNLKHQCFLYIFLKKYFHFSLERPEGFLMKEKLFGEERGDLYAANKAVDDNA